MSAFGKCNGGGRRAASRSAVPLRALVTTLHGATSAVVVDFSATGVRLRGSGLPGVGGEMLMAVEGVRAFGTVSWADHDDRGVALDSELSPTEVKALCVKADQVMGRPLEIMLAHEDWNVGFAR